LLDDIVPRHDQDVVIDCTGSAEGFELALQIVRPRGTLVLKSTFAVGKPLNLAPVVIDDAATAAAGIVAMKERRRMKPPGISRSDEFRVCDA